MVLAAEIDALKALECALIEEQQHQRVEQAALEALEAHTSENAAQIQHLHAAVGTLPASDFFHKITSILLEILDPVSIFFYNENK